MLDDDDVTCTFRRNPSCSCNATRSGGSSESWRYQDLVTPGLVSDLNPIEQAVD